MTDLDLNPDLDHDHDHDHDPELEDGFRGLNASWRCVPRDWDDPLFYFELGPEPLPQDGRDPCGEEGYLAHNISLGRGLADLEESQDLYSRPPLTGKPAKSVEDCAAAIAAICTARGVRLRGRLAGLLAAAQDTKERSVNEGVAHRERDGWRRRARPPPATSRCC